MFYGNFVPKMHRFWDIRLVSTQWPWNPGKGSPKVIGTDTNRSATYDFLLTFHSNHGPSSYRFRDKRRFQSKIVFFPTPCILRPAEGFPWNWVSARGSKTRMMELPGRKRSFTISSALWIQSTNVTDRQDRQTDRRTDTGRQVWYGMVWYTRV